jgi:hypothetical protein
LWGADEPVKIGERHLSKPSFYCIILYGRDSDTPGEKRVNKLLPFILVWQLKVRVVKRPQKYQKIV